MHIAAKYEKNSVTAHSPLPLPRTPLQPLPLLARLLPLIFNLLQFSLPPLALDCSTSGDALQGLTEPLPTVTAQVIRLLLANGMQVNVADEMEWTPLHHACCAGKVSCVGAWVCGFALLQHASVSAAVCCLHQISSGRWRRRAPQARGDA